MAVVSAICIHVVDLFYPFVDEIYCVDFLFDEYCLLQSHQMSRKRFWFYSIRGSHVVNLKPFFNVLPLSRITAACSML